MAIHPACLSLTSERNHLKTHDQINVVAILVSLSALLGAIAYAVASGQQQRQLSAAAMESIPIRLHAGTSGTSHESGNLGMPTTDMGILCSDIRVASESQPSDVQRWCGDRLTSGPQHKVK